MNSILHKTILFAVLTLAQYAMAQVQFSENFNSGTSLPSGWTQISQASDGGWKVGAPSALSSSYFPIAAQSGAGNCVATNDDGCGQNCNKNDEWLITPDISISGTTPYLSFDCFFFRETFQGNTESATVKISIDGGATYSNLRVLDGSFSWRTEYIDLSAYVGQTVKIGFNYSDGTGWLYGWAIDNVIIFEPADHDVVLSSIDFVSDYIGQTTQTIQGTFFNKGGITVSSIELNYQINNGAIFTQTVNVNNIAPFSSGAYTHPTPWTPSTLGPNNVRVWISQVNGQADADSSNNELTRTINVASQTVTRIPLIEVFSSNTCPPCRPFNQQLKPILESNNANKAGASNPVTAVKYQMNWPSPGTDRSYNADGATRRDFYGVSGIPDAFMDGIDIGNVSQTLINNRRNIPSVINLQLTAAAMGNTITTNATITSYINLPAGLRLYVAIVEEEYTLASPAPNQEISFQHVMRKMLPNGSGLNLSVLQNGVPFSNAQTFGFTVGNVTQNSFNLWVGVQNAIAVAWVQDPATGTVFQSAIADVIVGTQNIDEAFRTRMFPNPANEQTIVRFDAPTNERVQLNIVNMTGQVVDRFDYGHMGAGEQNVVVNTSHLPSGMYLVQLTVGNQMVTKRLSVTH